MSSLRERERERAAEQRKLELACVRACVLEEGGRKGGGGKNRPEIMAADSGGGRKPADRLSLLTLPAANYNCLTELILPTA